MVSVLLVRGVASAGFGLVSGGNDSADRGIGREIVEAGKATEGSTGRPLDGSKSDCTGVEDCAVDDVGARVVFQGLSINIEGIFVRDGEVDQGLVEATV